MKKVLTTCGYCGCGCNLYLTVEGGRITGVLPKPDHPVSQGMLCSKGWQGHGFARHPDRLDQPLLRQERGHALPNLIQSRHPSPPLPGPPPSGWPTSG